MGQPDHAVALHSGPSGVRALFGRFRRLAVIPESAPPHWRKMLPQRNPFSAKMFPVTAISPTFYSRNEDLQVSLRGRDRRLDDSYSTGVREIKNDGLLRRQYGKGRRHDDEDARR